MKKAGVFNEHYNLLGGGTVHSFKLVEFLKPYYDIDIYLPGIPKTEEWMDTFLNLDTSGLNFYEFKSERVLKKKYDLFLNVSHWRIVEANAKKKFAVVFFPQFFFPIYDYMLLANSQYTKKNIIDRWKISEDRVKVLYPPVMTKEFKPLEKTNSIVHVSRIAYPRPEADKGHRQMIQAFKELCDNGLKDWEFNIVGQVQDVEYFNELQSLASGYPIKFHKSIPFNQLKKLYGQAKIYWHLTGITMPNEAGAQEHLGIVVIEAMASGAVPVCLNTGGIREIFRDGAEGCLVKNVKELKNMTEFLIDNPHLCDKFSVAAQVKAEDFDEEISKKKFYNITND